MFYDILDKKRIDLLPKLEQFKKNFYLGGGTALALQLGHRDSIDFDFFTNEEIDTSELFKEIKDALSGHAVIRVQEEHNTLSIVIDEDIKMSFFAYPYPLLNDAIEEEYIRLASVEDIGCMKLSAITGRATNKDYIDLYYILQDINLEVLLERATEKLPDLDKNLILKSIVYFDDITTEPIMFKNDKDVDFEEVKEFLVREVRALYGPSGA